MFTKKISGLTGGFLFAFLFITSANICADNLSVEVQENIDLLIKNNQCVDCSLVNADLNRMNLSGADLRGADLSNASLFLADLSNANLTKAILHGTKFGGADLAGADLRGADLRGVKIEGAYLVGSKFDGTLTEVNVSDDESLRDVVEETYIPDDSVPKQVPEQKQVNIAERRDFGPVPPQIDPPNAVGNDALEGGPMSGNAPPKKAVSPVAAIVLDYETSEELVDTSRLQQPAGEIIGEPPIKMESSPEPIDLLEKDVKKEPVPSVPSLVAQSKVKNQNSPVDNTLDDADTTMVIDSKPDVELNNITEIVPVNIATVKGPAVAAPVNQLAKNNQEKEQDQGLSNSAPIEEEQKSNIPLHGDNDVTSDQMIAAGSESVEEVKSDGVEVVTDNDQSKQLDMQKKVKKSRKCYNCNLVGSDFSGVNLDGADLEGTDFTGANLERTDFEDANLKNVSFKNANLKNAKFNRADLYKADFDGADLTGAEFKKALTDDANFQNTTGYGNLLINQPE